LTLKIHPSLGAKLKEGFISTFTRIQLKYFIRLKLVEDEKINPQAFRFVNSKSGEDITQQFT
jgi:ribonuclease G